MTNLNGFLAKTILIFSVFLSLSLIVSPILASSITATSQLEYKILENGDLEGVIRVTLDSESSISEVINFYTLVLPFTDLEVSQVTAQGTDYTFTEHEQTNGTDLVINFGEEFVSNTSYFVFDIFFSSEGFFEADEITGRNVSIPTAIPNHTISKVTLVTPEFWGTVNWSSEKDYSESANILTITSPTKERLSVIWGEVVSYDFTIAKTYTNYDSSVILYDLFVPSSNSNQLVVFSEITPAPQVTTVDENGNTMFSFLIDSEKELEITISGEVLMRESSSVYSFDKLSDLTESMKYWELTDDDLTTEVKIALKGKGVSETTTSITQLTEKADRDLLYRSVYDYIQDSLELSSDISEQVVITARRGATNSLTLPGGSVSVEDYADSLVAVLRSFEIPSVVVSGYIPKVSGYKSEGFFHTWVEYWNQDSASWVILDPALSELVGQDLYSEAHTDHIAFTTKGGSSLKPNISYFADSELSVSLNPTPSDTNSRVSVDIGNVEGKAWESVIPVTASITNEGNSVVEITGLSIADVKEITTSTFIAPGQTVEITMNIENAEYEELELIVKSSNGTSSTAKFTVGEQSIWWWNPLLYIILATISLGVSLGLVRGVKFIKAKLWK